MESIPKYFFAGAAAALALLFVSWQMGYDAGLTSAPVAQTAGTTQLLSSVPTDGRSITGKITDISGTILTMTASDSAPPVREVTTNTATVFARLVPKDQEVFESEMLAFDAKRRTAEADGTPLLPSEFPSPFASQKLSLSDLRVGDIVTAVAANSILSESEFTAMTVIVQNRATQ